MVLIIRGGMRSQASGKQLRIISPSEVLILIYP